jgi:hypothetical protein
MDDFIFGIGTTRWRVWVEEMDKWLINLKISIWKLNKERLTKNMLVY